MSSPGLDWTWRCAEAAIPAPPPRPSPPPSNSSSNSSTLPPAPSPAPPPTPPPQPRLAQLPAFEGEQDRCDLLRALCGAPAVDPNCKCADRGDDVGYHCDEWTTGDDEWCFVDPQSICVNSSTASTGLRTSTDPCRGMLLPGSGGAAGHLEFACLLMSILGNLMLVGTWGAICVRLRPLHRRQLPSRRPSGRTRETAAAVSTKPADIDERFASAQKTAIERIGRDSPQETKLLVFGLYRQATEGDCRDAAVPVKATERKKHEAWAAHRGMPRRQAMLRYCELVEGSA